MHGLMDPSSRSEVHSIPASQDRVAIVPSLCGAPACLPRCQADSVHRGVQVKQPSGTGPFNIGDELSSLEGVLDYDFGQFTVRHYLQSRLI